MIKEFGQQLRTFGKSARIPCYWALLLVVFLNVIFLASALWVSALPREPIAKRVRTAFASSELTQKDYLRFDKHRGWHQYNDCLILQMIINQDENVLASALGPLTYSIDEHWTHSCSSLYNIVVENEDASEFFGMRYTRYWHGYRPLNAVLLLNFELSNVRTGLKFTLYATLIFLILCNGRRQKEFLVINVSIATVGILFWAVPYFGQSLCHGPGDTFVIFGITCLLCWRDRLLQLTYFVPFCAAYGAGVVYFEFLTGLLPTAMGLLFPVAYAIAILRSTHENSYIHAWMFAITGLLAFAFGGILTVAIKQLLSLLFADPITFNYFFGQLKHWVSPTKNIQKDIDILKPYFNLFRNGHHLTYGSKVGAIFIYVATTLAWITAGYLAIRISSTRSLSDLSAFAMGALVIIGWIMLFQTHTYVHSFFMVRILIVPISLGWGALAWQLIFTFKSKRARIVSNTN